MCLQTLVRIWSSYCEEPRGVADHAFTGGTSLARHGTAEHKQDKYDSLISSPSFGMVHPYTRSLASFASTFFLSASSLAIFFSWLEAACWGSGLTPAAWLEGAAGAAAGRFMAARAGAALAAGSAFAAGAAFAAWLDATVDAGGASLSLRSFLYLDPLGSPLLLGNVNEG
jgi:hypothetical protein